MPCNEIIDTTPDTEYRPSVDQDTTNHAIDQLAREHDLTLEPDKVASLGRFISLLSRWGSTMRLTADPRPEILISQHLPDALVLARLLGPHLKRVGHAIDVGSGPGLPALPLAIVLPPTVHFNLVESRGRRCSFMRTAIYKLGLDHCQVINKRLEDIDLPAQDLALSRATFPPPIWLQHAPDLVGNGGLVVLLCTALEQAPEQVIGLKRIDLAQYKLANGPARVTALYQCST